MKRTVLTLVSLLLALLFAAPTPAAWAAQQAQQTDSGSSLILFDQSGSMGRYDPLEISKIWLMTLAQTFEGEHKVKLIGFDEKLHPPIEFTIGPKADMSSVLKRLNQIKTRGKVTDLELPFKVLKNQETLNDVSLILIITDGKPEIWDEKLSYLSPEALRDPRYDNLRTRYAALKEKDTPDQEALAAVGPLFQQKNLSLIKQGLKDLPKEVGYKTVIWDLSSGSAYLRDWSRAIGAEHMVAKISDSADPVNKLLYALLKLQLKISDLTQEPLSEDLADRQNTVLSVVKEADQKWKTATAPEAPTLAPIPEAAGEAPVEIKTRQVPPQGSDEVPNKVNVLQKTPPPQKNTVASLLFLSFILVGGSLYWVRKRFYHPSFK